MNCCRNFDYSNPQDRTDENFNGAHQVALYAEARILSAMEFGEVNPDISATTPKPIYGIISGTDEMGAYEQKAISSFYETWNYGSKVKYGISRSYIKDAKGYRAGGNILHIHKFK